MAVKPLKDNNLSLAIDNSLGFLNLALGIDGTVLEERHAAFQRPTSEVLSLNVKKILYDHDYTVQDVGLILVTLGPGSFTGIRVALSFAKGLSTGLGIEVAGVSTLDVLAYPFRCMEGAYICPLIDAKKGEVFLALYRVSQGRMERLTEYEALRPVAVPAVVRTPCILFGSGVRLCEEELASLEGVTLMKDDFQRVNGEALLRLGMEAHASGAGHEIAPVYGRRSEAEIKFNVKIE